MRSFELEFGDLTYEKQQEMIEAVKADWIESLKQEGRQELLSQRVNRTGKTNEAFWKEWKEQHSATDDQMILIALNELYDWEEVEDAQIDANFWKFLNMDMEDFAEKKAEEACWAGVHNMEMEVETP